MNSDNLDIVIIGLSLSSSWGNGHATTYRSLVKGLRQEHHNVLFFEKDIEWYSANRDLNSSPDCKLIFYHDLEDLKNNYSLLIRDADVVIVGSYLQNGVDVGNLVMNIAKGITAFYDIDTPVTLEKLEKQDYEYIHPGQIPEYDIYLSFSGGKALTKLEEHYDAGLAKPLYCSVDTDLYYPEEQDNKWHLGYLGTYSDDRQPTLKKFLIDTAVSKSQYEFVVAGPQYPDEIGWPENVERIEHLPPAEHRQFYNSQLYTLNVTREAMIKTGFSPSVRLFEAAACGTPIISDYWEGLENIFEPGREILVAESTKDVEKYLEYSPDKIEEISRRARQKILDHHTSHARAKELISYVKNFKKTEVL